MPSQSLALQGSHHNSLISKRLLYRNLIVWTIRKRWSGSNTDCLISWPTGSRLTDRDYIYHIMDQQLPVRLSSDQPPSNWDELHESTSSSEPTYLLLHESATSDIKSLLSARFYPLPNSHNTRNAQNRTPSPSHGDLALELASFLNPTNTNQTPLAKPKAPGPQKRQRRGSKKAAPSEKNRGAPQDDGGSNESHEEVRGPLIDLHE